MQILKRFVILFTMAAFLYAVTGCATNGRGVAAANHSQHTRSSPAKTDDKEDSSGYSTTTKAIAIGAGAVVVLGALAFAVAYLGAQGLGQSLAESVAMH